MNLTENFAFFVQFSSLRYKSEIRFGVYLTLFVYVSRFISHIFKVYCQYVRLQILFLPWRKEFVSSYGPLSYCADQSMIQRYLWWERLFAKLALTTDNQFLRKTSLKIRWDCRMFRRSWLPPKMVKEITMKVFNSERNLILKTPKNHKMREKLGSSLHLKQTKVSWTQ